MKSDLIEHPCVICEKPSRSCGHTRADRRAFYEATRIIRRAMKKLVEPKHRHLSVPSEGSKVFQPKPDDERETFGFTGSDGRVIKCRNPMRGKMVRQLSDDEYCGK